MMKFALIGSLAGVVGLAGTLSWALISRSNLIVKVANQGQAIETLTVERDNARSLVKFQTALADRERARAERLEEVREKFEEIDDVLPPEFCAGLADLGILCGAGATDNREGAGDTGGLDGSAGQAGSAD